MKKITAFFLALFPVFVIVLLYISGVIVKDFSHVWVTAVEITESTKQMQWQDQAQELTDQLTANVIPFNANNPEVYWQSSDESIVQVDDYGNIKAISYGIADVYAVSKENPLINGSCRVEIWDDKIHDIKVNNTDEVSYLGHGQEAHIDAQPVPKDHLEGDKTLHYSSSDPTVVDVGSDGELIAKQSDGNATITITANGATGEVKQEVQVKVGLGVQLVELDDDCVDTVKATTYDFASHIKTYPDTTITKDKFIYESSNEDVASIDENGQITFHKNGKSEFSATYKGNKKFKVSKVLENTFNFVDVAFNKYKYSANIDSFKNEQLIDWEDLNVNVYPETADYSGLELSSSNPDVVSFVVQNNVQRIKVNGVGESVLTAKITLPDGQVKTDYCMVTIKKPLSSSIVKEELVELSDTTYYYLKDNIDTTSLQSKHEAITWTLVSRSEIAILDAENGIIHFKDSGQVRVKAQTASSEAEFNINCSYAFSQKQYLPITTQYVIHAEVGQQYTFGTETEQLAPDFVWAEVSDKFIMKDNYTFIPKSGCNIEYLPLYNSGSELVATIHFIVSEQAKEITYSDDKLPYYVTASKKVNFLDVANIKVIPTTAHDDEGNLIKPSIEFTPIDQCASIDEYKNINFSGSGDVLVDVTADNLSEHFDVRSTYNTVTKFDLVNEQSNELIQSGSNISLSKGQTVNLYLHDIFTEDISKAEGIENQFTIESMNGNEVCSFAKPQWVLNTVVFSFTGLKRGTDVLAIRSTNFVLYLNINVETKVDQFHVLYKSRFLESNTITYIQTLKVDVVSSPISSVDLDFKATLNGSPLSHTGSSLTLNLQSGNENTLILTSSDSSFSQTFNFTYRPLSELNFTVAEEKADGSGHVYVYIPCGGTQSTLTVVPDGLVDDDVFNNFTYEFTPLHYEPSEEVRKEKNKFTIYSIPLPSTNDAGYENTIKIKYSYGTSNIEKDYYLSRDTISKLVFPGHDNKELADKPGLQRVRVFGNTSTYSKDEGNVDYYKMPFEIYDFQNQVIEDPVLKKAAFDTLKVSLSGEDSRWVYHEADEFNDKAFIELHFDNDLFYSMEEIYYDIFDSPLKHDTTFSIETQSGLSKASYDFKTVFARNAYVQEGFKYPTASYHRNVVLQTNFGVKGIKDGQPYEIKTHKFDFLYGNGYTFNFDYISRHHVDPNPALVIRGTANITLQGSDEDFMPLQESGIKSTRAQDLKYFSYSTYKYWKNGFQCFEDELPSYIKKCLFYCNTFYSLSVASKNEEVARSIAYLEDSIFFNAGATAINVGRDTARIYLKGFIDVYNFQGREMATKIIPGLDLTFLWDTIVEFARDAGVVQKDAALKDRVNSSIATLIGGEVYFWHNEGGGEYRKDKAGNPDTFNYVKPFFDIDLVFIQPVSLWATLTKNTETAPDAPSYYDEFDEDGNLREDFLAKLILKIMRQTNALERFFPNYF